MTTLAPESIHSRPASAAVQTLFQTLTLALRQRNAQSSTPIQLQSVRVTCQGELRFSLRQEGRCEAFTTQGGRVFGRGGSFDLSDARERRNLLETVTPLTPTDLSFWSLRERLAERGFTLLSGPVLDFSVRDEDDCTVGLDLHPLRAVHSDGRVVWLSYHTHDAPGEGLCGSVRAGPHWLACFHDVDQDLARVMDATDAELDAVGASLPDAIFASTYRVSGDALDALLERLAQAFPADDSQHLLPLPHAVPADFFSRLKAFEDPALGLTRAQRQAQRQADERDLPASDAPF